MTPESRAGSPEEEIFRDALHRTADALPPLPDLVPDAVREGERRRVRSRGLAVAGTFVAVTAVTLGLALLGPLLRQTPDTEPAAPAPGPSITRPTPAPSPDPTEPVTGMPIPATPPTPTPTAPLWSPPPATPWPTSPAAPPATPDPARSATEPFAPSPHPGATS
ncbi:hypothetical protein AB0393_05385 [Streptomyces cyaneofuscatus]|uniref:hypothetical protein n=1 Tax=Streptomyces TaxID=1883 RepID=UPI000978E8AF|nr:MULTISPECIES: hypothetical protein [unclassified Streptomyces]ONI54926.1 hypothetical protein STIB_04920 [Streptomyces sp. IB2014 011-1]RDV52847.1 hypothetical protein DDV98_04060 [Streptomyces sp. IB2014 011-12]